MSVVRRIRRTVAGVLVLGALGLAGLALWAWVRSHPQDLPWTPIDLAQPPGPFTVAKLTRLRATPGACEALLTRAGIEFEELPAREGEDCGYADAVRLQDGGALSIDLQPDDVGVSCPVAGGLALWSWHTLVPRSRAILGSPVVALQHYGAFSCRRINGAGTGRWSEHATANALDVAGVRLADGRRITVARDWGDGTEGRFLREARDGACRVFGTTLSPDYNAAHADHLHLDQAAGRARGVCR